MKKWGVTRYGAVLTLTCVSVLLAAPTYPSVISFAADQSSLQVLAGNTVVFTGEITNISGQPLSSTDFVLNFTNYDPLILNPFQLLGATDFTLADHTRSGSIDLFSVDLAASAIPGISYGLDVFLTDTNNDTGNTETALVIAKPSVVSVPEPGTLSLAFFGLISFLLGIPCVRRLFQVRIGKLFTY